MRRVLALVLALASGPALAETLAAVPPKFPIPWGNSAGAAYLRPIPQASQIGIQNCAASLTDGFPPLTFVAQSSGGCPPWGQDMNGILKQLSQWSVWASGGAGVAYDSSFQASIGGYPLGATLVDAVNPGCFYYSTADNNATNPTTGGAGWTSTCPGGGVGTGLSTGSANAQAITTTPFKLAVNSRLTFEAGLTNTGPTTLAVNGGGAVSIQRRTPVGDTNLAAGEIVANSIVDLLWNGSNWEIMSPMSSASLTATDQVLSGGANVIADALTAGNITVDCGIGPLQWIPNTASFTIAAPTADGSCMLQVENGVGAQLPNFSGFTTSTNKGDPFTSNSGDKFVVSIWRIHGVSSYINKALQ